MRHKEDSGSVDARRLYMAVVYIKALHEFTNMYHR